MDRREALGAGLTFGAGLLGGGLTSGLLVHLDAQARLEEKDREMHKQLAFHNTVQSVDRELDLSPQQYAPISIEGSNPITGEPRWFEYRIEATAPIDVLLMEVDQFANYQENNEYRIIEHGSSLNTDLATGSGLVEATFWILVVDNTVEQRATPIPAENHVDVKLFVKQ